MKKQYAYAGQEDEGYLNTLDEVLTDTYEDNGCVDGIEYTFTIFRGEVVEHKPSQFTPNIAEYIAELACDECHEWCDYPFEVTREQDEELQELVDNLVDKFYEDNNIKAGYFMVEDVKEFEVKVKVDAEGSLQVLDYGGME